MNKPIRFLNSTQAANLLGLSTANALNIRYYRRQKWLPPRYPIGDGPKPRYRYIEDEVIQAIKNNRN